MSALVTRRYLHSESPVSPWIVSDPQLRLACDGLPPPLPLIIEHKLGEREIADLVTIEFEVSSWLPDNFPLPVAEGTRITQRDYPEILADIRRSGAKTFGPDFDQPGPSGVLARSSAEKSRPEQADR